MAKKYNKPIIAVQPWGAERTSSIVKNAADVIVGWNALFESSHTVFRAAFWI